MARAVPTIRRAAFVEAVSRAVGMTDTRASRAASRATWPTRSAQKRDKRMTARERDIREGARLARERDTAAGTHPDQLHGVKRANTFRVLLTGDERAQLIETARKAGQTPSDYLRGLILAAM